jgi:hypothetical protein
MFEYLDIVIPTSEYFDEEQECFKRIKGRTIRLKHSLVSLSQWEAKYHKPFLYDAENRTDQEMMYYIKCMTITSDVDPLLYSFIPREEIIRIKDYIDDPMTATTIKNGKKEGASRHRDIITNEIIYWQMIELGIPFECEKWHLNRLLMLIQVCNEKNTPGKKMSNRDILNQYSSLNKIRRAKSGSRG